jgi:NOL1/NOP2/fmu family ribosome biogenesis protein
LALSLALNRSAFARVDVDYETALTYLRRETIAAPEGAPRGFNLLYFDNVPLGFVKNLGNRVNNLYPAPWRILSAYTNEIRGIIQHS